MDIGDERFGPQGSHWGAQINMVGSLADFLIEAKGGPMFEAIDSLNEQSARELIWELTGRLRMQRLMAGGDSDPVVQN